MQRAAGSCRLSLSGFLAATVLLLAPGCRSPAADDDSDEPERLQVLVSVEGAGSATGVHLVIVELDTPHREVPIAEQAISPASSPDGSRALFVDPESHVLYEIDLATGQVRSPLGDFAYPCFLPAWSPDGSRIAFAAEPESSNREIYVHDIDQEETVRLTHHQNTDSYPSWDATGKRIFFTSDRNRNPQLYMMGADGSGIQPLIRYLPHEWTSIASSPRGDSFVFTAVAARGDHHLFTAPTDGSPLSQLTSQGAVNRYPAWSPGGRFLAYVRYQDRQEQAPRGLGDLIVYDTQERTHTALLRGRVTARAEGTVAWRRAGVEATSEKLAARKSNAPREKRRSPPLRPARFTVTNTQDRGRGSLRWAIEQANQRRGPDTIVFNIPTSDFGFTDIDQHLSGGDKSPDVFWIRIRSHLSVTDDGLTIDGRSQTTFTGDTNPAGPEIVIDGSLASTDGLMIASNHNHVRGLNIQGCNHNGIVVRGKQNWIEGNYIGTDATGTSAAPNVRGRQWLAGVWLGSDATGNTIGTNFDGTADAEEVNVISGNSGHGICIAGGSDNLVAGNRIGVDTAGVSDLGNAASGIMIRDGRDNTVGGVQAAAGNVIGSNEGDGVSIAGENASGNRVLGNHIGTNRGGAADLGHGLHGVGIHEGAHGNAVGGFAERAGNTLAFNKASGVAIVEKARDNTVRGNVVVDNRHTGITIVKGSTNNLVQGNFVGVAADGKAPRGNGTTGVRISDGTNNRIGGTAPGAGNVISANGVRSDDPFACGVMLDHGTNVVQGNRIGTDITGAISLGNATHGISVRGGKGNLIGGSSRGAGNLISGNHGSGIIFYQGARETVVAGNRIGTDASGRRPLGNRQEGIAIKGEAFANRFGLPGVGNTIAYNAGRDVSLLTVDKTGEATRVSGILNASPGSSVTLDFYAQPRPVMPAFSDANRYLGSALAAAAGNGVAPIDVTLRALTSPMEKISVTATDGNDNHYGFSFDSSPADTGELPAGFAWPR